MKMFQRFAVLTVLIGILVSQSPIYGQDPDFKPPGTEESAAVDEANVEINAVYKELMGKMDTQGQKSLKDAQRSWIKWRDDEALLIARVGGAVGGSSLRVDFLNAQLKLIHERTAVLKEYLTATEND